MHYELKVMICFIFVDVQQKCSRAEPIKSNFPNVYLVAKRAERSVT